MIEFIVVSVITLYALYLICCAFTLLICTIMEEEFARTPLTYIYYLTIVDPAEFLARKVLWTK